MLHFSSLNALLVEVLGVKLPKKPTMEMNGVIGVCERTKNHLGPNKHYQG